MKVVIIDDELPSRENLSNTLATDFPELEIVGEAYSVDSGVDLLSNCEVDLVFLDIDLGSGTGFNILEKLEEINFQIVFVTAYNDYAIRAFKVNALDYILKPINDIELAVAIEKAKENKIKTGSKMIKEINLNINDQSLGVKEKGGIRFIKVLNIIRCKADKNYTEIYLDSKERIVSSKSLKEYAKILESYGFFRIHQSHLVNLKKVKRILREDGIYVQLENNDLLQVSRRKKDALFKMMESFQV